MFKYGRFTILSLLLVLALALVACGGGAQEATPTEAPAEEAALLKKRHLKNRRKRLPKRLLKRRRPNLPEPFP